MSAVEITVVLKDSERTYRQKFLEYNEVILNPQAEFIQECIKSARENFQGIPEDVVIKASMVIQ